MTSQHRFFDGRIAKPRPVSLNIRNAEIELIDESGVVAAVWRFANMRVADQNAVSGAYVLRLDPDHAARLEVMPGADLNALMAYQPQLARWRQRERARLFKSFALWGSVGALVLGLIYFGWTRASVVLAAWIPWEWENRIGNSIEQGWIPEQHRCTGADGLRALQALGDRLWPNQDPNQKVKLFILREGDPNAFAIPGHRVVVFSGLIEQAKTPEMLAGVLAHEMGHVELHHPMRGLVHQLGLGVVLGLLFGDSSLAGVGQLALALSYSRDMEREADQRGLELLQRAGIRADGMAAFFAVIKEKYKDSPISDLPEFLSSHPDLDARIAATQQPPTGAPAMSAEEWAALRKACDAK